MQNSDISKKGCSLEYLGKTTCYTVGKDVGNPYMLDAINEIDTILAVSGERPSVASFRKLNWLLKFNRSESGFNKNHVHGYKGDLQMVRVSECKYLVATVCKSSISIQKSPNYDPNAWRKTEAEAEFTLAEGKYSYLEWSPLNDAYFEKPSFLTLDDKGSLRLHSIEEKIEEVKREEEEEDGKKEKIFRRYVEKREQVMREGEVFRCATFSVDGRFIYAINDQQGICKIDLQDSSLVKKRIINGLSSSEEVISSHIQQLAPWIFAIGSVMMGKKPYLHLVYGDITDQEEELKIKAFEIPLLGTSDIQRSVMFRTLYVKERQLLLFGHTESNKVRFLKFGLDFNETEIEGPSLGTRTLRGAIFMKEERPNELKNQYQNKELELSRGPQFLILDSLGGIHHFRYSDTNNAAPTLSLFTRLLTIGQFMKKQENLKARLNRMRKNRCKSQTQRMIVPKTAKKKERSKSQVSPSGTKISSGEKLTIIKLLKGNLPNASSSSLKPAENPLFKVLENPFLSMKKAEDKPTTGLFSAIPSLTQTTGNSLFSFSSKPSFSFQKSEPRNEPQNSLFGPSLASANKVDLFTKKSQSTTSNLFSANSQNRAFQTVLDDPIKKKASLLLNKLESDVTFKVEDQEFPAHKSILSEKSSFFKNMFSSGMSESHSPVIEISDIKASMFKGFLQYVYLGQAILNEELAIGLYGFSEKYMIDELKVSCENYLTNILSLKNCFKIFETVCFHEADSLKKKTVQFFQDHLKEITESKDFEDLPKETYLYIKRMQWNEKIILDPSFDQFIKN